MVNFHTMVRDPNHGDLEVLELSPTIELRPHENSVDAISVDPVGQKMFASGSHDRTIKIWDAAKMQKPVTTMTGNKEGIWSLEHSLDGKKLLSASPEGIAKIWDAKSGKAAAELRGHTEKCYYATFSDDGNQVASCGADRRICLFDVRKPAKPLLVNEQSGDVIPCCSFTSDQKHIISGTFAGRLNVLSLEQNKMLCDMDTLELTPERDSNTIFCVKKVRGHSKNLVIFGAENEQAQILEVDPTVDIDYHVLQDEGKFQGHWAPIRGLEVSKGNKHVLTACADHSLRIWDFNTKECLALFTGHLGLVSSCGFLANNTMVSASWDQRIMIWDYTKALQMAVA